MVRWHKITIDRTKVYEEFAGNGYGKYQVMKGIEFAKEKGVKVARQCSYTGKIMERDERLKKVFSDDL